MLAMTQLVGFTVVESDQYFSSVSLLLHCDGIDATTVFPDSSASQKAVTANGNVQVDTAQSKFNNASALFDGSGDYLSCASDTSFALSGDFTVEFWVRFNSLASSPNAFINTNTAGGFCIYYSGGSLQIARYQVGGDLSASWSPSTGIWYHLAATRSGSTERLFVDGTQLASGSAATSYAQSGLVVGKDGTAYLNGWIDDFRFTKGVARYTGAFSVPTQPFPDL